METVHDCSKRDRILTGSEFRWVAIQRDVSDDIGPAAVLTAEVMWFPLRRSKKAAAIDPLNRSAPQITKTSREHCSGLTSKLAKSAVW